MATAEANIKVPAACSGNSQCGCCSGACKSGQSQSPSFETLTPKGLTANCGAVDIEELRAKLKGTPDFDESSHFCKGCGKYCLKGPDDFCVRLVAHAHLPSRFGENFELYGFYDAREDKEHTAMVVGDVRGKERVPVRVHSECHTGDVMGSLRCDCRDQLEASLKYISKQECGIVLYLRQEGRGIGLLNKIKAYRLQELGLDTVEANLFLGFPSEGRDYKVARKALDLLGVRSIMLLTNNPDKIDKLTAEGVKVEGRIPIVIPPQPYDEHYLAVKKEKMGHMFPDPTDGSQQTQSPPAAQ